jgi:hypothetical protein
MIKKILVLVIVILSAFIFLLYAQERKIIEEFVITTYYPSPHGVYNELQANKLAVGDTNRDGKLDASDQPPEEGQLQVSRSVIFTPRNTPGAGVREGEVIYNSLTNSLRYFDGTKWLNVGGVCYTHYCYNRGPLGGAYNHVGYGSPTCLEEGVELNKQGPCDTGFVVRKDLGAWGYCFNNELNHSYFLPPGGTCGPASLGYCNGFTHRIGKAYLCCQ